MSKSSTQGFVRYYNLDGSYWAPTIDLSYYLYDPKKETGTSLIVEEEFHRYLTVNTMTRLDMSWEEALTSIEVLRILDVARSLCNKFDDFRLRIPLEPTLRQQDRGGTNSEKAMLNLSIRDLVRASKIIKLYEESCEALIEPLTMRMLDGFLQIPETRALFKRVRQIRLSRSVTFRRNYLSLKKQLLRKCTIKTILAVAACILDIKTENSIPPLLLDSSFDYVNEKKAENIKERSLDMMTNVKQPISSEEEVYALAEQIGLEYSSFEDSSKRIFEYVLSECVFSEQERFVFAPLNMMACYSVVDYPANKSMLESIERGWTDVSSKKPPNSFVPKKDWERPDVEYCFKIFSYLGTPSISVAEDTDGLGKHIIFRTGLPSRVATELLRNVQLTSLKYFLLSGEVDCPFVPLDPEKSCVLTDLKNESGFVPKTFIPCHECIVTRMLRNVNIKMDRNT